MDSDTHREMAELLTLLEEETLEKVLKAYRNVNLPSSMLEELFESHPDEKVYDFLAVYPQVPSRMLEAVAEVSDERPDRLVHIARHPRCGRDRLMALVGHSEPMVRLAVAEAKELTPQILEKLSKDKQADTRAAIASNPALPTRLQPKLVKDKEPRVRAALAKNKTVLPEVLIKLSLDPSPLVQTAAVTLSNATSELQLLWADHGDPMHGRLLLHRSKPEADALASLSLDSESDIAIAARMGRHPGMEEWAAQATGGLVEDRLSVLEYPDLPLVIQALLMVDPEAEVRQGLAAYPDLAPEIFTALMEKGTLSEQLALAERKELSPEAVLQLCASPSTDVQRVIAFRKGLTEEQLRILVNQGRDERVIFHLSARGMELGAMKREVAEPLVTHASPTLRRAAAASHHILVRDMMALVHDPVVEVRRVLSRNLAVGRRVAEKLALDPDPEVVETIRRRLAEDDAARKPKGKALRPEENGPAELTSPFSDEEEPNVEVDPLVRMASRLSQGPRAILSRMMRRVRGD